MVYEQKLPILIAKLREVVPTLTLDAYDDQRRRHLLSLLDDCEQKQRLDIVSAKKAFFAILFETAAILAKKESSTIRFRQLLKDQLADIDVNGSVIDMPLRANIAAAQTAARKLLVDSQEFLFVFLYENAKLALSSQGLFALNIIAEKMLELKENDSQSLRQTNWNIALLLYQEYEAASANKNYLADILFGYLANKINYAEIRKKREETEEYIEPLTLHDFLFYKMTLKANTSNAKPLQKEIPAASLGDPFLNELLNLMRKRATIERKGYLPKTYDERYMQYCQRFVFAVNKFYQSLENLNDQKELKDFVERLRQYDGLVRSLQARVVALSQTLAEASPGDKYNRIQKLKKKIEEMHEEVNKEAKLLTDIVQKKLDQGSPSSKWRLVLGIGLVIVGAGLLLAGIAGLLSVAPIAYAVAIAATFSLEAAGLSWAAIALGGVSLIGGGISFFKGLPTPPHSATTAAFSLIKFCQDEGLKACEKIENTNVLGMSFGLES